MARLPRVFQKLFATSADVADCGQFGSLKAGTKVNTKDPSTIQALAAFLTGWKDAVISGAVPSMEEVNSLFLLIFYQLCYVLENGIPEYDASTTYYIGSIVMVSGTPYTSLQDNNTGNSPASSPSYWQMGIQGSMPAGMVMDYAGNTVPSGWLLCDGSAISRTTYARLFAAIGTTWGSGDGSTTFNLPPGGIVTVGYKSSDSDFNAVGKQGGAKTHTLTDAEIPLLNLYVTDPGPIGTAGDWVKLEHSLARNTKDLVNVGTSGQAHNNLQPYGVVKKIISY